jgi:hypothetical protein
MRRISLLSTLILGVLSFTACPSADSARKLSSQQLQVQQQFQAQLTKYFGSMDRFADNHVTVSQLYFDDLLNGIDGDETRIRRRANRDIAAINADGSKTAEQKVAAIAERSQELGRQLEVKRAANEADKLALAETVKQYKAKNQEILATYQAILDAQAELDHFIQIKKFDEVIGEQLLGKIHLNQVKVIGLIDQATSLADKLKFKSNQPVAANASGHK